MTRNSAVVRTQNRRVRFYFATHADPTYFKSPKLTGAIAPVTPVLTTALRKYPLCRYLLVTPWRQKRIKLYRENSQALPYYKPMKSKGTNVADAVRQKAGQT